MASQPPGLHYEDTSYIPKHRIGTQAAKARQPYRPQHLNATQFAKYMARPQERKTLRQLVPHIIEEGTDAFQKARAFHSGGIGMALRYTAGISPLSKKAAGLYQAEAWQRMAQPED